MVVFPNAKINIGLNIVKKLASGYHAIESCFYPIPLNDALEVVESDVLSFTSSGIVIPGDVKDNLCLQAYSLVKEQFDISPVAIHLHKNIPIGAGLGGGSSDGAFMIKLLNDKFSLNMPVDKMVQLAEQLGSDCAFFIKNEAFYVEGTGNVFSEISFSLCGKHLVLVMPKIHVSTTQAYNGVNPTKPASNLKKSLESLELTQFDLPVKNDFESSVFNQFPEIELIKKQLINTGALYASMSGSGSAVYGIFDYKPEFTSLHPFQIFQL